MLCRRSFHGDPLCRLHLGLRFLRGRVVHSVDRDEQGGLTLRELARGGVGGDGQLPAGRVDGELGGLDACGAQRLRGRRGEGELWRGVEGAEALSNVDETLVGAADDLPTNTAPIV